MPGAYSASAKRTINKQVYSILFNNPTIFDGVPLFDDAHGNLIGDGAAPSINTLQAIMLKLLGQKDPFGESIMVQPRFVIVPVGYGFLMSQILQTAQIDVEGIGSHTAQAVHFIHRSPDQGFCGSFIPHKTADRDLSGFTFQNDNISCPLVHERIAGKKSCQTIVQCSIVHFETRFLKLFQQR